MEECIFCKIAEGKMPSEKIHEDEKTMTFMDIAPSNKGHCLVITKKHYETFNDVPEDELKNLISVTQKISNAIVSATSCHGYNVFMNNNKAGGQIVPHVHFHIVPRFEGDGVAHEWKKTKYIEGEMKEYGEAIRKRL